MTREEFDLDSYRALKIIKDNPMHPIEEVIRKILPRSHSLAEFAGDTRMSLEYMALVVTGKKRLEKQQLRRIMILYNPGLRDLFELRKANKSILN